MPAPCALAWFENPPTPETLAEALAQAASATAAESEQLLRALESARSHLETTARRAFRHAPLGQTTAAFHSALPDLRPFVLYRLPGLLREAGLYTADELRSHAAAAPPAWLAREATRQLAILAAVHATVRRLQTGQLPPAAFPEAIRRAAREVAAIRPAPPPPSPQEDPP
ncbi:hypothetical protein [Tepidiforma sp.]|uniref:hypothetical protein n=1 Tax=Tepidiforma sp. TaxID=2682230 RepID=UPI002ADDF5F5|nr:hypothetical protein [Tepidiforma sp.]